MFNHMVEHGSPGSDSDALDRVFAALADPNRRRVLALLREAGELRVTDLAEAFDMSLNGVSKHIKVLERAGVLKRRVDGRTHWLSVSWASLQGPYEYLHAHHHFWSKRLDALVETLAMGEEKEEEEDA